MLKNKSIVASGHPAVSKAALAIMEQGGNAFDAVVAAGFTSAVAEPALTSVGGGGFLLAHTSDGDNILFDFFSNTPGMGHPDQDLEPHFFPVTVNFSGTDQDFNVGMGSVAVPGNLKGYLHVHNRLGTLPLEKVLAPAINCARHGIALHHQQAHFLQLLYPIMTMNEAGRKLFAPNGKYLKCGDHFHNHDFASFLEELATDQGDSFYSGKLALQIEEKMQAKQGLLTQKDLSSYAVIEREPLHFTYRGFQLFTNPPPSFGGSLIGLTLHLLQQENLQAQKWGSLGHLTSLCNTLKEVDRRRTNGETAFNVDEKNFQRGTTHVSIVDKNGNVASMTTSNGEGSGYIVPGTGIMLNNMMGEDDLHPEGFHACPPGQRVASMMSPSLLLKDNEVALVIGSGGSKRIRTAISQVLSNVIDFGLDINTAVKAPRIHWDGELLQVEPGYDDETVASLNQLVPCNAWDKRDVYFGGVHAVIPHQHGAGDPRRGGDSRESKDGE